MRSGFTISHQRRRNSSGNSLIEAAFTILPTFALIFGFFDFGIMFFGGKRCRMRLARAFATL